VREATLDDMPLILEMGAAFHKAAGNEFDLDTDATAESVAKMMEVGCVLITDRGMIGGTLAPAWCQPNWTYAIELFWWAEDGRGRELLRGFEEWARRCGANELRLTTLDNLTVADMVLTRCGYSKREASYAKEI